MQDARLDVTAPSHPAPPLQRVVVTSAGSTGSRDFRGERPLLRVLVADGDLAFAAALGTLLGGDPLVELVAVVSSPGEAAESLERLVPDVALIGEFPGRNLGHLRATLRRLDRVAAVLLLRPDREEEGAPREFEASAFLRREPSAEETLKGFFEVAVLAVVSQISRAEGDE